jgi:hypothetical protein
MPRILNEAQLRGLIRKMVTEYVTNNDENPHKDVHADPTAKSWDTGLDELDELDSSDLSQAGPSDDDAGVEMSPTMDLGEVDGDPHAEVHADPTAKSWDTGLD